MHGVPAGSWQDLLGLPLRISRDAGFRSDLSEVVCNLQADNLNLPDALDLLLVAVGGSSSSVHTRELAETSDLLGGFLASVGRWPGIDAEPILAEGEIPAGIASFTHPPATANATQAAVNPHPLTSAAGPITPEASSPDSNPRPAPEFTGSGIDGALARLERGNLELRAHLESIDQRISRIEPLLELSTPLPPAKTGPRRTLATAWQAASEEVSPPSPTFPPTSTRTPASEPRIAIPRQSTSLRSVSQGDISQGNIREEPPAPVSPLPRAIPAPQAEDPRPSRAAFLSDPPPATAPEIEPIRRVSASPPPSEPEDDAFLLPGFLNTGIHSPDAEAIEAAATARRRRSIFLACLVLFLLALAGAGAYLYLRTNSASTDPASTPPGITALPAPRTSDDALISSRTPSGPLTATPGKPSASRVLDARSAFKPQQTEETPGARNGFRPAETFVSASIMEGRLLSAPLPDHPRTPESAGLKGLVILEANISPSGLVEDADVLGGSRQLRSVAIDTVRNWRYRPYLVNGSPVEVRTIIRMDFNEHKPEPAEPSAPFPQ